MKAVNDAARWDGGLDRRQLLVGGASLAVGAAVVGRAAAAAVAVAAAEPLSVGYLNGSDEAEDLRFLPWGPLPRPPVQARRPAPGSEPEPFGGIGPLEVVPAADEPLGDQSLALETVEVRVAGLYPRLPPSTVASFWRAYLTVFFPSPDPLFDTPVPFTAWSATRRPRPNAGSPTRFVAPLGVDGALEVLLEVWGPPAGSPPRRFATNFTVDWFDGRPKLRRGLYLLGLAPGVWDREVRLPARGERPLRWDLASVAVSFEPLPAEA